MIIKFECTAEELTKATQSGTLEAFLFDCIQDRHKEEKPKTSKKKTKKVEEVEVKEADTVADVKVETKKETLVKKEETKKEEEITITADEVKQVLALPLKAGKSKEIKELFQSYGGNKLSDIDPSDYADLIEKAKAL